MPTVQPKMTDNSSVNALTGLFPMLMVFDSKVDEGKEFLSFMYSRTSGACRPASLASPITALDLLSNAALPSVRSDATVLGAVHKLFKLRTSLSTMSGTVSTACGQQFSCVRMVMPFEIHSSADGSRPSAAAAPPRCVSLAIAASRFDLGNGLQAICIFADTSLLLCPSFRLAQSESDADRSQLTPASILSVATAAAEAHSNMFASGTFFASSTRTQGEQAALALHAHASRFANSDVTNEGVGIDYSVSGNELSMAAIAAANGLSSFLKSMPESDKIDSLTAHVPSYFDTHFSDLRSCYARSLVSAATSPNQSDSLLSSKPFDTFLSNVDAAATQRHASTISQALHNHHVDNADAPPSMLRAFIQDALADASAAGNASAIELPKLKTSSSVESSVEAPSAFDINVACPPLGLHRSLSDLLNCLHETVPACLAPLQPSGNGIYRLRLASILLGARVCAFKSGEFGSDNAALLSLCISHARAASMLPPNRTTDSAMSSFWRYLRTGSDSTSILIAVAVGAVTLLVVFQPDTEANAHISSPQTAPQRTSAEVASFLTRFELASHWPLALLVDECTRTCVRAWGVSQMACTADGGQAIALDWSGVLAELQSGADGVMSRFEMNAGLARLLYCEPVSSSDASARRSLLAALDCQDISTAKSIASAAADALSVVSQAFNSYFDPKQHERQVEAAAEARLRPAVDSLIAFTMPSALPSSSVVSKELMKALVDAEAARAAYPSNDALWSELDRNFVAQSPLTLSTPLNLLGSGTVYPTVFDFISLQSPEPTSQLPHHALLVYSPALAAWLSRSSPTTAASFTISSAVRHHFVRACVRMRARWARTQRQSKTPQHSVVEGAISPAEFAAALSDSKPSETASESSLSKQWLPRPQLDSSSVVQMTSTLSVRPLYCSAVRVEFTVVGRRDPSTGHECYICHQASVPQASVDLALRLSTLCSNPSFSSISA